MNDLLVLDLSCVAGGARMVLDGGHMDRGCRALSGRVDEPGRIGGCRYARLRLDVKESSPASGEWHVWPQRVPEGGRDYRWEGLTDLARKALVPVVSRQVQAHGFHEAWLAAFGQREGYEHAGTEAERCRRHAAWWDEVAVLDVSLRAGELTVVSVAVDGLEPRQRVDVVSAHDGRLSWDEVGARLVWPGGEQAGWLTTAGRVVPLTSPNETHDKGLRPANGAVSLGV